uniref:Uncharacterized protein n=1 Tax=Knipowitschia caucasica TaxID=637954 RepID=A0AAV2KHP7_KNICA
MWKPAVILKPAETDRTYVNAQQLNLQHLNHPINLSSLRRGGVQFPGRRDTSRGREKSQQLHSPVLAENTNERKRTAVLLGLPLYLKEDSSNVFRLCDAHYDHLDEALKGMELGLLIAYEEEQDAVPHQVFDVAVVVEESIVIHHEKSVACGVAMLMGIIYAVNLEYPSAMKYTFEFLQKVVMKIKPEQASARIHGLRNKILKYNM